MALESAYNTLLYSQSSKYTLGEQCVAIKIKGLSWPQEALGSEGYLDHFKNIILLRMQRFGIRNATRRVASEFANALILKDKVSILDVRSTAIRMKITTQDMSRVTNG